jgi:hypothetical protein
LNSALCCFLFTPTSHVLWTGQPLAYPAVQKSGAAALLHAWITWRYRAQNFDVDLLAGDYSKIEHDVIAFEEQKPCIAVSSLFTIEGVTKDEDTVRIALNILPVSDAKTVAVFSYHKNDCELARAALDRVINTTGEYQKYELSKLVIRKMSNFYISPAHFEGWTKARADVIKDEFTTTIWREHSRNIGNDLGQPSQTEDRDFMLFG